MPYARDGASFERRWTDLTYVECRRFWLRELPREQIRKRERVAGFFAKKATAFFRLLYSLADVLAAFDDWTISNHCAERRLVEHLAIDDARRGPQDSAPSPISSHRPRTPSRKTVS